MEILCCVTFSCSRKAAINRLKDLLTKASLKVAPPILSNDFWKKGAAYLRVFNLALSSFSMDLAALGPY